MWFLLGGVSEVHSCWINLAVAKFIVLTYQGPDGVSHADDVCYGDVRSSTSSRDVFEYVLSKLNYGPVLFPLICESLEFVIVGRTSNMGESACGASFPLLSSGIFGLDAQDCNKLQTPNACVRNQIFKKNCLNQMEHKNFSVHAAGSELKNHGIQLHKHSRFMYLVTYGFTDFKNESGA